MKGNGIKHVISTLLIFMLIINIPIVFANNKGDGKAEGGVNTGEGDGPCGTWDYCYLGENKSHGVRLSLYKYEGGKVSYYGSRDYCAGNACQINNKTVKTTSQMAGRIAYQYAGVGGVGTGELVYSKKLNISNVNLRCYTGKGCSAYPNATSLDISNLFGFGEDGNYDAVQDSIYQVFGKRIKEIGNLSNIYITVEPTVYFYANSKGNSGTTGNFYGTAYELIHTYVYTRGYSWDDANKKYYLAGGGGTGDVINYDMPLAIMTSRVSGARDANCFVYGNGTGCSDGLLKLVDVTEMKNIVDELRYDKKGGYGIAVFWLGDESIVTPPEKNCQRTCSGKSGDDLLGCAEDFCQANSTDSDSKKKCITTCGYTEPKFNNCASSTSVNGKETYCDATAKGNLGSCTPANTSTYYQTNCNEESTIDYGNSLPKTLQPGTGFGYTPVLSGSKTCTMTFEVNKWKFDYAASYTTAERNSLKEKLKNFRNVSSNSVWSKDLDNKYKYDSSDADISIEVTNSNDVKSSNRKTTKKLIPSQTINLLNSDVVVTSGGSAIIPLFAGGSKSSETIYGIIKTNSSNKTSYKLPAICMKTGSGELYEPSNGKCNSINDGPYYEYYTDLKIKKDKYDTKTTVKKSTSSLNVQNTCNYSVDSPVSCSIVKGDNQYELIIHNKNGVAVTYGLSNTAYVINNLKTYSPITRNIKLYGAVAIDNSIVATCKYSDVVTSDDTCTAKFKAADYSSIKEYCDSNWLSDTANYASADDCFNSCSSGNNSCKNNPNFSSSDKKAVENYCKLESNYLKDGYKNTASCINDCLSTVKVPKCLGITCDYIYRPISLVDPFPNNRTPGYNWIGKEIYITDDLQNPVLNSSAPAEYVIELTPERINEIKKNTKEYNSQKNKNAYIDYVPVNEYNLDGKYESKFIHSSDITQGGFSLYFTKIATVSQK